MEPTNVSDVPRRRLLKVLLSWEAATSIATIASAVILLIQTQQIRRSVQRDTYQKAQDRVYDLDRNFIDHPDLREYFYGDQPIGKATDALTRARVESTAEWISDLDDSILSIFSTDPDEDSLAWRAYIDESIRESPALRDYVKQHRDWYSQEFVDAVVRVAGAVNSGPTP